MTEPSRRAFPWVAAFVAALLFGPGLIDVARLSAWQWKLDRRLRALDTEHATLTALSERLRHDDVFIEGEIRSTFKVAKPDELVVPLAATAEE
ncbi:MAG TPA: hypothetical protein VGB20_02540 [bacterium]